MREEVIDSNGEYEQIYVIYIYVFCAFIHSHKKQIGHSHLPENIDTD